MAENCFNAVVPNTGELCHLVARISLAEIKDSSAKSHFHWKTMKCRLILHTMQDHVIACPVFETLDSINVITSVEFFKGNALQNHLKSINMTWSTTKPVTSGIYANCLRYSIQFAIAPRWNRVGSYFISDEHFLTFPGTHAIKFNLSVEAGQKNSKSILTIRPLTISMIDLKLENLPIPREIIAHFMADPRGVIDVSSLATFRVTVLPSLKRAKLLTALKYIPTSCPFKNYGELRRHWKNMYGYRLPKTDAGIIYYEVRFLTPTFDVFLYPDVCVRSQIIERSFLGNAEPALRRFFQDLRETMPLLCGKAFQLTSKDFGFENLSPKLIPDENEELESHELPRTPKNLQSRRNIDNSTRLSFSRGKHRVCSQLSSLMSPTPSLSGFFKNSKQNRTPNLWSSKKVDEPVSFQPRTDNVSLGIQNRCPNLNDPKNLNPPINSPNFCTTKFTDLDPELMEMEFFELNHFPGCSDSPKIGLNPGTSTKHQPAVNIEKPTIISREINSRYFKGDAEDGREENATSAPIANTLSQKLNRNLTTKEKKLNFD